MVTMKIFEKQYKALANSRRLLIVKFLKTKNKASVGQIAKEIKLGIKSTSKHLRVLASVDFVDREQQSLQVFYFLPAQKPEILNHVLKLL
jgi:DNA-binding transcriptional ArsR family regulator